MIQGKELVREHPRLVPGSWSPRKFTRFGLPQIQDQHLDSSLHVVRNDELVEDGQSLRVLNFERELLNMVHREREKNSVVGVGAR